MKKIGVYKDGKDIQVAKLSKKTPSFVTCSQSEHVKPLYKSFLSKKNLVIGLDASDVMVHCLDFPTDNEKTMQKGMRFQAKLATHFDENSSIQIPIYQKKKKRALLYSTTIGKISKTTEKYKNICMNAKYLGCVPNALARFFKFYAHHYSSGFVFHFGKSTTTCVQVKNYIPFQFYSIDIGLDNFIQENKENLEIFDLSQTDKLHLLKQEIAHIFLSFLKNTEQKKVPVLLTGHISHFQNVKNTLFSGFHESISSFIDIPSQIPITHAIPIGLALDMHVKDEHSLQFFQNRAIPEHQINKHGMKIFLLFSFCLMLNLIFFSFENKKIQEYKSHLSNRFKKVIDEDQTHLGRNIHFFEKTLGGQVKEFDKILSNENRHFPFHLKVASVSQSLQWIHPILLKHNGIMKHFRYQLESFPSIENTNVPYVAKITMELTFKKKEDESHFHHALKHDSFIDHKKTWKWKKLDETIQTSFYLK